MPMIITNTDRQRREQERRERKIFATNLRNLLRARKMSQSALARLVYNNRIVIDARGYPVVYGKDRISSWVNGKTRPTVINMDKLCKALRVKPNDLWPGFDDDSAETILDKLKVPKPVAPFKVVKKPDGRFKIEEVRIDLSNGELLRVMTAFGSIMEKRQGRKTLEVRKR